MSGQYLLCAVALGGALLAFGVAAQDGGGSSDRPIDENDRKFLAGIQSTQPVENLEALVDAEFAKRLSRPEPREIVLAPTGYGSLACGTVSAYTLDGKRLTEKFITYRNSAGGFSGVLVFGDAVIERIKRKEKPGRPAYRFYVLLQECGYIEK